MTEIKEHSNFVKSLINFKNGHERGTGTRAAFLMNEVEERSWSQRISTRIEWNYKNTEVLKMIENEEKLNERLSKLEKNLAELSNERDLLKKECDAFRLIGTINNPIMSEDGSGEIYLAQHKIGIASLSIETRLRLLKDYQKLVEVYTESVKLDQNKIQIKSDIATRREIEKKNTTIEIQNEREAEKKKRFQNFYKSVTGIMKSLSSKEIQCSEARAVSTLIAMKVPVPDGYLELCGESFKKELKTILERKDTK